MSVTSTVTINSTEVELLPGTLVYSANPVTVVKPNEPVVIVAWRYQAMFEADVDNSSTIDSSDQGSGDNALTIAGFETIDNATISVGFLGEGIQKRRITISGTKTF